MDNARGITFPFTLRYILRNTQLDQFLINKREKIGSNVLNSGFSLALPNVWQIRGLYCATNSRRVEKFIAIIHGHLGLNVSKFCFVTQEQV